MTNKIEFPQVARQKEIDWFKSMASPRREPNETVKASYILPEGGKFNPGRMNPTTSQGVGGRLDLLGELHDKQRTQASAASIREVIINIPLPGE